MTRINLLLFSGLLLFWGCAPKREILPPPPLPSTKEVISSLQKDYSQVRTLQAWAKIKWKGEGQDQRGSAEHAVLLKRPNMLRVEGLSFLGTSMYTLIITHGELDLFIPSEKTMYRGAASPLNLERFLSLPFTAEEALSVLCGRVPICPDEEADIYLEDNLFVLELICRASQWRQRIFLDPSQLYPVKFTLQDMAGNEFLNVTWSDFQRVEGTRMPAQIQVEMPRRGNSLSLRLKEMKLNHPVPEERFNLDLPPNTAIRPL
jgi:outer membrane lipoprotein-sorting protein